MDYGVSFLTRNMRYRIVQKGDEHYILDMEQSIWPIFIPFLFWIIPQRMYKVDAKIVKQLKTPTSGSNNSIAIVLIEQCSSYINSSSKTFIKCSFTINSINESIAADIINNDYCFFENIYAPFFL